MRRSFSTWYSLASLCLTLSATLLLVAFAIDRYDCPNTSLEVRYTGILLIPTAYALFAPIFQRTRLRSLACSAWLSLVLTLVVVDRFNFIVERLEWLSRGAPPSGTPPWMIPYRDHRVE